MHAQDTSFRAQPQTSTEDLHGESNRDEGDKKCIRNSTKIEQLIKVHKRRCGITRRKLDTQRVPRAVRRGPDVRTRCTCQMRTHRVQQNAYRAAFTVLEVQACGVLLQAVPGTFLPFLCAAGAQKRLTAAQTCVWDQIAGWKAGHKRECHALLAQRLRELEHAKNWEAVAALEAEARAVARAVQKARPDIACQILNTLGCSLKNTRKHARGVEVYEEARALCKAEGDRAGEAEACNGLGICYYHIKEYARAAEMHEQRRALAEVLGDDVGLARACGNLANCHEHLGNSEQARELFEQSMAVFHATADTAGVALACHNLGKWHYQKAQYVRAREIFDKQKNICEALQDREGFASACGNLANCHFSMGDYSHAVQLLERQRKLCEELGDDAGAAAACGKLGLCHHQKGEHARAIELHEQHRALCEQRGDNGGVADACGNLALTLCTAGKYARACELYEEQKTICEAIGNHSGLSRAYNGLALCYESMHDFRRAQEMHEQHKTLCEALGDRAGVATACANLGVCYHSMGDYVLAREYHERDRVTCEELEDNAGVAIACGNLGCCEHGLGNYSRAQDLHEEHRERAEALGDRKGVARACGNIGLCHMSARDYPRALGYLMQEFEIADSVQVPKRKADSALAIGVVLRLRLRERLRLAASASALGGQEAEQLACTEDEKRKVESWLQTAADFEKNHAHLHLAYLHFEAAEEDLACQELGKYLSVLVKQARTHCAGCDQTRGEDVNLLVCSGCRVARFCNRQHQRMASCDTPRSRSMVFGKHSRVCALLGKWRQSVVKHGHAPECMREDLVAFLHQERQTDY